jgi:predicted nuclease of predicted toxin-antitoxin system
VRLLFDQNLSRHLLRHLAIEHPGSRHVTDVGLDAATGADIWAWGCLAGIEGEPCV